MAAAALIKAPIPKLCATDSLEAFGSCRLCLVEIEGRKGTPASCTTPAENGMVVRTQTPRLAKLRRGVMELYISDHPLDCLTCSANGDCELQTQAGVVGLRDVRYGYDGANHLEGADRRIQPLFHLRILEVHRLLALRARLRGGAGHVRADHARPRLRLEGLAGRRRLHVAPNASPAAPACRPARPRRSTRRASSQYGKAERAVVTTCAYCGVGCSFKAEIKGDDGRAHGPLQGGQGQRGPFLRQGPLRLRLRHPQGPHRQADDPRQDRRSRGARSRGTRRSATPRPSSSASRPNTAATRSARSPPRAAPTRKCSSSRSWCAPASATTTSTPARASAIRRPATA